MFLFKKINCTNGHQMNITQDDVYNVLSPSRWMTISETRSALADALETPTDELSDAQLFSALQSLRAQGKVERNVNSSNKTIYRQTGSRTSSSTSWSPTNPQTA